MQQHHHSKSGQIFLVVLFLVILAIAVGASGYLFWQNQQETATREQLIVQVNELNEKLNQLQTSSAPPTASPDASPLLESPTPSPATTQGTIQGKLSYPSEILPKQKICAVNQTTQVETCTQDYQGSSYKLTVPAATYQVYAELVETPPGGQSRAYYSEFVTCGLKYGCPSHKAIDVVVKAGETVQNIDPGDWYAGQ